MSSKSRNFRRRADDDDENDDVNGSEAPSVAAAATKSSLKLSTPALATKPKKHHHQAPKLLSFADDEENESPSRRPSSKSLSDSKPSSRSSKPSSSHKMTSVKSRPPPSSSSLPSNVQPQAGTYTKEALRELQKNTKTLASSRPPPPPDPKPSSEPVIVLKGLVKPVDSKNIADEERQDGDFEEEDEIKRERASSETRLRLGMLGIGMERDSSGSLIPDQATINAIRAKRERLRQRQAAAPDYISLDAGSNHGALDGLSDEEPEFQGRIAMFGEQMDSGKKGVFEDVDERVKDVGLTKGGERQDEDEDEEEKIWEEEQFKKGLGKRMDDGSGRAMSSAVPVVQVTQQQKIIYPAVVHSSESSVAIPPNIGGAIGSLHGLDGMPISQQAELARKALQENVRRLQDSHGRTMSSLTRTDENLSASLSNITALENSLSAAGEKFMFMQKLRDFVSVICDLLQHKAPFIEELEEQMQKLHEERASAIIERRAADNDDEMMEVEAAVSAAMAVFSKGGSSAAMVAAATNVAMAASARMREHSNLPVKLDEFGRDMNLQKRMDMTRRAEARQRRRAQSDSKRLSSMEIDKFYQKIEGESSTDESDTESTAYQSNRDMLLQTAEQIFSDAAEEYSQLSVVKERFERWKKLYSLSYRDAYMSLSIPAIFSPYVRLELLKWDPLYEDTEFDDMKWHSLLFNYGLPENGSDFNPDDADADLVPTLVEKIALPLLHHEIAHCWDMFSTSETKNAVSATSLVINYVPASSDVLGELMVVIRSRLADAVSNLMVPTWSPLVMQAVPNAARVAAYRFGMSVRLMRNICSWKDILALPVLEKLALDELLSGKVLPHIRSITSNIHDAVTRTERIVASLSGVWAGPSVPGEHSHKLQPLVDYVLLLGKTLERKGASGMTENETSGLARRLKKMLVELNEYDKARDISRTFHLREAL
ncbi:transcriptional repressor ILP1 [Malania oleifera]|uniref:transcriptional repressor ILP1 n=1 Tax=Malania oleifera TaxID=397392 RepID=UPI0025AE355A|nr:transcriptional repressor ILP1 [Malania oleifera]